MNVLYESSVEVMTNCDRVYAIYAVFEMLALKKFK